MKFFFGIIVPILLLFNVSYAGITQKKEAPSFAFTADDKVKNFEECFKNSNYDFIIYCSLNEKDKRINGNIIKKETNRVAIVIGPEGDFSKSEFEQLENNDKFYPVSLGTTVLKSETAAIVVTALLKNEINNAQKI